jgi:hypothetical protein
MILLGQDFTVIGGDIRRFGEINNNSEKCSIIYYVIGSLLIINSFFLDFPVTSHSPPQPKR